MIFWWFLIPAAYLIGGFPTANFAGRLIGHDPSKEGSKNPGATNVYRLAGYKAGIVVLTIDTVKGVVPVVIAQLFAGRNVAIICGAAAVLGHIFPVFSKFKGGGKGVATYGGMTIGLNPIIGFCALAFWISIVAITKVSSIASLLTIPAILFTLGLTGSSALEIWVMLGLSILITYRHKDNMIRLLMGEEYSLKKNQH